MFDDAHKKLFPKIPKKLALITSPTGAAIKDMISVIQRRFPVCEIIVRGVKVQGESASDEISKAIIQINEMSDIDLIIIGRGGGSLEDLWAFNEENVARAIYASKIPIISAVGHDIDYTISDFVADLRAPTPSVAAELAVPDKNELIATIQDSQNYLTSVLIDFIHNSKNNIYNLLKSYALENQKMYYGNIFSG